MRACEYCGTALQASQTLCVGCGATQVIKPTGRITEEQAIQQATEPIEQKEKGSWGCLITLVIFFWPAAVFYYMTRRWK